MDIGTGIAIAGVWIFPAACALSGSVSSPGVWIAIIVAAVATVLLA